MTKTRLDWSPNDLLFATQRDRCLYLRKTRKEKPDWLNEHEDSWRSRGAPTGRFFGFLANG